MKYIKTEEQCQKKCDGRVCRQCGNPISPIETVDNARNPTFWPHCSRCSVFEYGTTEEIYLAAKECHEHYGNISMRDLCGIVRALFSDHEAAIKEAKEEIPVAVLDQIVRQKERIAELEGEMKDLTATVERMKKALVEIASGNRTTHECINWARQALSEKEAKDASKS